MKKTISLLILTTFLLLITTNSIKLVYATNYLSNPSFTGGSTGWTLNVSTYNSTYYQDSAGSIETATAVGRNATALGTAEQTISTTINSSDTISLTAMTSKQCVAVACSYNNVYVEILKPSDQINWVTIWSDTSSPSAGSPSSWTGPSATNVSSYFDETGQYKLRIRADIRGGNNKSGQALAWFDALNLDVTSPTISVSVSDATVAYGITAASTSKSTLPTDLNDTQTATNDGDITEDFNIMGQDATGGGCTWTLAGSTGSDQYIHQFCNDTDNDCTTPPTNYTALTTSYQTLKTGVASSGSMDFQLRFTAPSSSSCYGEQSIDVTVQAVAQ